MVVNNIIASKPYLAWYIKNPLLLSKQSVLEHVLNYGNWEDIQTFISLLGWEKTCHLFQKSIQNKRNNYQPNILYYFTRYFHKPNE